MSQRVRQSTAISNSRQSPESDGLLEFEKVMEFNSKVNVEKLYGDAVALRRFQIILSHSQATNPVTGI